MVNRLVVLSCLVALLAFSRSAAAQPEPVMSCPSEPTDMLLSYGSLVTCEIGTVGDLDVFRFEGVKDEKVLVEVTRGDGGIPCVDLWEPSGGHLGGHVCGRVDALLEETGIYTIEVGESLGDGTVSYRLVLERIAPASPTAADIVPGSSLVNVVDPEWDYDFYAFHGLAGDSVTVAVGRLDGGQPCLEVYAPDGTIYNSTCFANRLNLTLTRTGPHVIVVSESVHDETLRYNLTLQCFGACPLPPPPGRLTCDLSLDKPAYSDGDTVLASIRLANPLAVPVKTEIKLWLEVPGFGAVPVATYGHDGSLALPPAFDQTLGPSPAFTVAPAFPRGTYEYDCRMLDPTTGRLLTLDLNPFAIE